MSRALENKVAFITGASRGIGAEIARRLAREGAIVAFTYSSSPQKAAEVATEIEAPGGRALAIQADSADADALKKAIQQTVQAFGRLDVMVNNAGVAPIAKLEKFSLADLDRLIAINIRAAFVGAQEASRHMVEGGRIITIGSCTAERMPFAGGAPYAMSKAALVGLVRGLARDLGPRGITVNNIQPGPIDTDMCPANGPANEGMRSLLALNRYGNVEDVAGLVAYIAGPESGFITGASLTVDGGFTA
ncbi:MAG: 3-oxoacyl-ACP reductase family protein [Candidatus Hydrogenedentes bacterium]|nr:3-oxoacyl-ACP reductase family protein [Candidatus Hydrogenedentota bacterium]